MESLQTDRLQPQSNGSSTFFISRSPRTKRASLDTKNNQQDSDNSQSKSEYLIAKPLNSPDETSSFHRVYSQPHLDTRSYSKDPPSVQRPQHEGSPKPGVRYIGGYLSNSENEPTREQSPVKIVTYERSPNSSRRSSEPFEIIRPQPRHADGSRVDEERRSNLDYTGEYEKELMYLPKQLQQVTQQIHQQHNLSPDSNPNTREYNTALLLSYRRSREDLLDNSPNRSPSGSPSILRKISDPLYNRRISSPTSSPVLRQKKTAVVSPLLDLKSTPPTRPRSVPPGLLMFDPTDPESEGYQQVSSLLVHSLSPASPPVLTSYSTSAII